MESLSFESPTAFVDWLLDQAKDQHSSLLEKHLPDFEPEGQEEIGAGLKSRADHFMRTDLESCLHVAALIKEMAEITDNRLFYALGLRAEGNGYAISYCDYQRGIDCYDKAAEIYRAHGRKMDEAWSQNGKIYALSNLGRYEEALAVGEWACQIFFNLEEWLPMAEVTVNMAIIPGRLGQDQEALQLLDRAAELYLKHGGDTSHRLDVVDMNRLILLKNLGRFEESIALNKRLLEKNLKQAKLVAAARSQQNLGITYFVLGRYNEAMTLLDAAQRGFSSDGRFRNAMLVELFTSDCLLQLRRFNEALNKCRRARALFDQLNTPYEIGRCLLNESLAYIGLEQYELALASLWEARALFEEEGNQTALADADLYIAKINLGQGKAEEALALSQKSLAVFRDNGLPLGQTQAQLLAAQAALALNRPFEALTMVSEVLSIAGDHNLSTAAYQSYHLAGTIAARSGDFQQALADWEAGIGMLEQVYGHLMLEYRADFAQDKIRLYEDVVALYICQDRPEEALNYAERAKSRALQDLLAYRLDLRIEARSTADQPLVDKIFALRQERNRLYRRWHTRNEPGEGEDIAAELTAKQTTGQQVADLERQMTDTWHQLLVRNADYAQEASLWQVRAEPVQSHLGCSSALIEYFVIRDHLVAFVMTTDSIKAISFEISIREVQQLLQLFGLNLRSIPRTPRNRMDVLTHNIQGVLNKLYTTLFEPLSEFVQGYEQLIIVPHGPLHYLPFQALYDGGHYLLEQYEISYLPASSLLKFCQTAEKAAGGLLALGFSSDGRLPQAPQEAEQIAAAWSGQLLVEETATLANFHKLAGDYRVIHLATHGEFRADNPLFSGLSLADGWLTTLDIFNLDLKASLVTLSACQTGRSVVGGGDELLGLLRAFLAAGAGSLVSTFWAVEDQTTADLMHTFYEALSSGVHKGAALRKAQLALMDKHPYFWAPFFLVGDTGPL